MLKTVLAASAIAITFAASDAPEALPNASLTPGAVRTTSRSDICSRGTAYLRSDVQELRSKVAKRYGLKSPKGYEIDHLIPLGIGGANVKENLWPQPWPEAHKKDRLEWKMRELICSYGHDPAPLQAAIAADWRKAYHDYMGDY